MSLAVMPGLSLTALNSILLPKGMVTGLKMMCSSMTSPAPGGAGGGSG
jgi:hypothetical protein